MERKDLEPTPLEAQAANVESTRPRDDRNLVEKARDAMTGTTRAKEAEDPRRPGRDVGVADPAYDSTAREESVAQASGAVESRRRPTDDIETSPKRDATVATPEDRSTSGARANGDADALLPTDELTKFQTRWQQIQVGFVDEPREAVQHAEALVNDVVTQLTDGFTRQRQTLEQSWSGGNEASSTEEMRVALQRYRTFFQRLLTL